MSYGPLPNLLGNLIISDFDAAGSTRSPEKDLDYGGYDAPFGSPSDSAAGGGCWPGYRTTLRSDQAQPVWFPGFKG